MGNRLLHKSDSAGRSRTLPSRGRHSRVHPTRPGQSGNALKLSIAALDGANSIYAGALRRLTAKQPLESADQDTSDSFVRDGRQNLVDLQAFVNPYSGLGYFRSISQLLRLSVQFVADAILLNCPSPRSSVNEFFVDDSPRGQGFVTDPNTEFSQSFLRSGAAAAPARAPSRQPVPDVHPVGADEPQVTKPLPAIRQVKQAISRLIIIFGSLFTIRYFYWRSTETMNPAARWFFWGFLIAEVLNFIEAALFYVTTWAPTRDVAPSALGNRSVDVFIATYNEPIELLRETVLCAVNMTYPHKTYVLDVWKPLRSEGTRQRVGRRIHDAFG